jgi:chemotaxis protein CheD
MEHINLSHYLYPGNLFVTKESGLVTTLLGSCVSVCLFDPVSKVAGINHYLLPVNEKNDLKIAKYGDTALAALLDKMLNIGAFRDTLQAKVFGGAELWVTSSYSFYTGAKNLDVAFDFLKKQNIKVVSSKTGGNKGCKIIFDTGTGIVKHKYIGFRREANRPLPAPLEEPTVGYI